MINNTKEVINSFLKELKKQGKKQSTILQYQRHLKKFIETLELTSLSKVNLESIKKFSLFLKKNNYSVASQNYHLISLRSFLKFLKQMGFKTISYKKIKLQKYQRKARVLLEKEEIEKILDASKKTNSHSLIKLRDKALLEILLSSDLKVSQISKLKIEDFLKQKIKLSNQAIFALKKYLHQRKDKSEFLFIRHDRAGFPSTPLTPRSIQRIVKNWTKKAAINKKITPEVFRKHKIL